MLKYRQVIKRVHGRNSNFVKYDEAFSAKRTGSTVIPWQQVESEELSLEINDPSYIPYDELICCSFQRAQQNHTHTQSTSRPKSALSFSRKKPLSKENQLSVPWQQ